MIITGKNYIDQATLTSSSGISGQNIEYLKIPQLSKNFIMNGPGLITVTGISSFNCIIIDKGTCSRIDIIITYNDTSTNSFMMDSSSTCFYKFATETNVDEISIQFTGDNVAPSIGYLFVGDYLQLPPISPTASLYYITTTQKTNSISGQQFTDKGYQYISTSFEFPRIPESSSVYLGKTVAGRQEILATWKETEFQYSWLFPWENSLDKVPPIFGSIENNSIEFDKAEDLYWSLSFTFVEIK